MVQGRPFQQGRVRIKGQARPSKSEESRSIFHSPHLTQPQPLPCESKDMVKVSTLFYAVVLSAAATDAWSVSYHTRNNIRWDTHGTRDVSCNKLNWSTGNAQEDVQYIKCVLLHSHLTDLTNSSSGLTRQRLDGLIRRL